MASTHHEPNADAMPTAGSRYQVGLERVAFAIGPLSGWLAAEPEITVPGVVVWPVAGPHGKRAEFFGGR